MNELKLTERQIQKQITDYLDKVLAPRIGAENVYWYHTELSYRSKKGFPDLTIMIKIPQGQGKVITNYYIEVKTEKGRITKEQQEFYDWVNDINTDIYTKSFIVRSLDECLEQTNYFGFSKELK